MLKKLMFLALTLTASAMLTLAPASAQVLCHPTTPTLTPFILAAASADATQPPASSTWGHLRKLYGSGSSPNTPGLGQRSKVGPTSSSRFATDQCTWYAASEFDKIAPWPGCNWGGNAGTWIGNASAAGWRTFAYPAYYPTAAGYMGLPPGSIVVWTGGAAGHVAVVRYVFQNGIYIQEKNWPYGSGVSGWRLLYWSQVLNRSGYSFSGYIAPWRR